MNSRIGKEFRTILQKRKKKVFFFRRNEREFFLFFSESLCGWQGVALQRMNWGRSPGRLGERLYFIVYRQEQERQIQRGTANVASVLLTYCHVVRTFFHAFLFFSNAIGRLTVNAKWKLLCGRTYGKANLINRICDLIKLTFWPRSLRSMYCFIKCLHANTNKSNSLIHLEEKEHLPILKKYNYN